MIRPISLTALQESRLYFSLFENRDLYEDFFFRHNTKPLFLNYNLFGKQHTKDGY
jgi:hypothetical protein